MTELKDTLQSIVKKYAQYSVSEEKYCTNSGFGNGDRQQIEAQLISVFSQYITQDGTEPSNTDKHWKKLRFVFHPDKFVSANPEVRWLEYTLSKGEMNGACFKLVDICASELANPTIGTDKFYENITHIEQLIKTMHERRRNTKTLTEIALIDSILALLESFNHYTVTTGKIGPGWLSGFMSSMPWLTSGFCIGLYLNELSLLYALMFAVSKSGQYLEHSNSRIWQTVGHEMRAFSLAISRASAALIMTFINVNVRVLDKVFCIGIETCANIYTAITSQALPNYQSTCTDNNISCATLSLNPQTLLGGRQFQILPLKFLAANFESYLEQQKQQYFASWRLGDFKKTVMHNAILQLLKVDRSSASLEEKLEEARIIIRELANNRVVNVTGSYAAKAIREAKLIQQSFTAPKEEMLAIEMNEGLSFF